MRARRPLFTLHEKGLFDIPGVGETGNISTTASSPKQIESTTQTVARLDVRWLNKQEAMEKAELDRIRQELGI